MAPSGDVLTKMCSENIHFAQLDIMNCFYGIMQQVIRGHPKYDNMTKAFNKKRFIQEATI